MLKLKTTVLQKKAIALAVLWCWTSGEAALLASGPASFEALPTGRLMAALGQGEPGEGVQICVEVARRFRKASAVDRSGMPGLRVTRLQHYRSLYERQQKY